MMEELMIFQNEEFGEIRAQEIEGAPWFCLADVCRPLGIQTRDCRKRLKQDGVVTIHLTDSLGRPAEMLFVNEANLYRAIFQRRKKAGARRRDYMALTKLDAIAEDRALRTAFEGIVARETARAAEGTR